MIKAGLALEIDRNNALFPVGLFAENLGRNLVDLGLACVYQSKPDDVISSDLPFAARTRDDVVVVGRLVWENELNAPAFNATE
ncbi:MAG TPA: hypothetical protein VNR39_12145 [Pseudolabrys sp.]|nr:hypothetical protein [Pseudolabrys sp.]